MIGCIKSKLSRIVTAINNHQFLIEGTTDSAKLGFQSDENSLNFVDIEGGPFLHIGYDFFGKGIIKNIEKITLDNDGNFTFKVSI
jgi:hypothetical protein